MRIGPRPTHPYAHAARLPDDGGPVLLDSLLPGSGPLEIEIGPGRGGFLFERAAAAPDVRLVGFEIRLKWAHIVDQRLKKAGLGERVRVLAEDAGLALPRLGPDASVRAVFLHFPDPWWKKRHEKRLVMKDGLLESILRLLEPGGAFYIQTDVEERAAQYAERVASHPGFVPAGDAPGDPVVVENPYGARSPREHRAIEDGLPVYRLRWQKG
ncbi:MAG: tRNA (guanine-N7)-methyltransferase [Myxococcales bacterium]|nr:tRNA (guanine-N7)-methyltransferase [Myxococcales bacterium]